MVGQVNESLSYVERVPAARYSYVLRMVVLGVFAVQLTWNEVGVSTSLLHQRLFLMGVTLVFTMVAATLALVPWWGTLKTPLVISHLVIIGLYLGLAIATTDWNHWSLRGWWQGWWAFPLLSGQIQQVQKLLRVNA